MTKAYYCNGCGKHQDAVDSLIALPAMFICNECVAILQDIEQKRIGVLDTRLDGLGKRFDDLGRQFDRLWQMQWGTLAAIVVAVLINHFWK